MVIHRRGLRPTSLVWHPRLVPLDVLWAGAAAMLAFWLRNPEQYVWATMSPEILQSTLIYVATTLVCAPLVFAWIGIGEDLTRYFTGREARGIIAASIFAVAIVAVVNFVLFRLDNAPRSIPVLHFLLLAGGLMFGRSLARLREKRRDARHWPDSEVEHILIVGSSRLASFYVRMIDELAPTTHRPLAIFDDKQSLVGRSIAGCPIVGAVADLPRMVAEYDVHGIKIHRVVIAKPLASLSAHARQVLDQLAASNILIQPLDSQLFVERSRAEAQVTFAETPELVAERRAIVRRPFWLFKRAADIALSGALLIVMAPIACVVAMIAFYDVGHPVVFWQRRVGRFGSPILVSKFRTLRAPFDARGRPWSDDQRLTPVGKFLRATRCDEIPQLFSVLTGEMSIVGPRPLLPHDQPDEIGLRLMVAPGLTGWAQVNGGKTVTIAEKDAMDEYYVRHASVWLDLWILLRTPWMMVVGDRRGERAISLALEDALRHRPMEVPAQTSGQSGFSDAAE